MSLHGRTIWIGVLKRNKPDPYLNEGVIEKHFNNYYINLSRKSYRKFKFSDNMPQTGTVDKSERLL